MEQRLELSLPAGTGPAGRRLRIAIFGLGCVGTTAAACLLRDGHAILGIDTNKDKVGALGEGRSPVVEPEVADLLEAGWRAGRLQSSDRMNGALDALDMALVCVGTPSRADGRLDLAHLLEATRQIGHTLAERDRTLPPLLLVFRSTMPPGTIEGLILPTLQDTSGEAPGRRYEVAYNPEFLREATAVEDYLAPPKTVIGERAPGLSRRLMGIYDGIDAPLFEVPFATAEMAKFVDNSFHALKVAFANEIGRICLAQKVDPQRVMDVFLADTKLNLSPAYLRPGGPYGGSCLPKDLGATIALAREAGTAAPVLEGVRRSNEAHLLYLAQEVRRRVPPPGPVLQLGLSFKAGTDDLRNSPLVALAEELVRAGYQLLIYDPDVQPARLMGANFAHAAEHRDTVLGRITDDLDGALARAELVILGKPVPGLQDRLLRARRLLDLDRLRLG
ncbi:MAG TPA: nucleotide sugar dehydrogenase [Geminicoccaceae bacterium]|nr:nucleotide sugar dehydrogenase [Geminicoccaceae bacterium]